MSDKFYSWRLLKIIIRVYSFLAMAIRYYVKADGFMTAFESSHKSVGLFLLSTVNYNNGA